MHVFKEFFLVIYRDMSILLAGNEVCLFVTCIFRLFIDCFPIPDKHICLRCVTVKSSIGLSLCYAYVQKVLEHFELSKAVYKLLNSFCSFHESFIIYYLRLKELLSFAENVN